MLDISLSLPLFLIILHIELTTRLILKVQRNLQFDYHVTVDCIYKQCNYISYTNNLTDR